MRELKLEELTTRQKLGMTFTAFVNCDERTDEEDAFIIELIKNHSLGAVWIRPDGDAKAVMSMIKEVADYPILIMTDAETGIGQYRIGNHNSIGCTGSTKHAYAFGKVTGVSARKMGYNLVCCPVVDMSSAPNMRSLGSDKYKVSELAVAEAMGLHDGGVLSVAKHYPGGENPANIDTHMAESVSYQSIDEVIDYSLYPYRHLMEKNLIDGIMTGHRRMVNIDPEFPTSLSKKVINIIRDLGFEGFAITDALSMMGIRAKFGETESKGLALAAGNDLILPFYETKKNFEALCKCYEMGMIPDSRLNQAAGRVLEAQRKTLTLPRDTELTEEEKEIFYNINKDCVYTKIDSGVANSLSRDGKHFFAVMVKNESAIPSEESVDVDTFSGEWKFTSIIKEKLRDCFPNSAIYTISEFPNPKQNFRILTDSLGFDEVVFITFSMPLAFVGPEHLTKRIVNLISAMQLTDRISTVVHFGNPSVLEELPHIPRCVFGGLSRECIEATIEVLAGMRLPKGTPTFDFNLK